jgi:hypothetical protein
MKPVADKVLYAYEVSTLSHGPIRVVSYDAEDAAAEVESWFEEIKDWQAEAVTGVKQLAPATKKEIAFAMKNFWVGAPDV